MTNRLKKRSIDLAMLALCVALALWLTRPWILHPLTTSIGFSEPAYDGLPVGDIMLSVGLEGWLSFAPATLHQWPLAHSTYLMYPYGASHGRSFDGLLAGLVTSLFVGAGAPLMPAHNLAMIFGLAACGFVCWRIGVKLWGRGLAAFAVGVGAECMPYLMQRVGAHPNLVYIWTVPLAFHLFLNLQAKPTWKRAAAWGGSFALLAASSWYILIMGLAAQACCTVAAAVAERFRWRSRLLGRVAAGWVLGLVLIVVVGWPMIAHFDGRAPIKTDFLATYSVPLAQFLLPFPGSVASHTHWAWAAQQRIGDDWEAYSGGPIAALALMLVYLCWRRPGGPRLALALMAAASVTLCVGPYLSVTRLLPAGQGMRMPLYYLAKISGAFNVVRIPGRMHPLLNFAALFAAGALLAHWRTRYLAGPWARRLAWPALVGGFLAINYAWSLGLGPYAVCQNPEVPKFYRDLGKTRGSGAVMDVPISYYRFPYYNYYQFFHKRPIVSPVLFHDAIDDRSRQFIWERPERTFFIDTNKDFLRTSVLEKMVDQPFMAELNKAGVEYLVVHKQFVKALRDQQLSPYETFLAYEQLFTQAWRPRLVYEDKWIRAYSTSPLLKMAPVVLPWKENPPAK